MQFRRLLSGRFVLLLVFGGLAYWNFHTGHTVAGTVILAVVLSVAILWVPAPPEFTPFHIHIKPLRPLVFEFKMTTEEKLNEAMSRAPKAPHPTNPGDVAVEQWFETPGRSPLRQGVRFTMLKPPLGASEGLIFWDDFAAFSTDIDRAFWFAELSRPATRKLLSSDKDCPGIHLDWTYEGLVISAVDTAEREEYGHDFKKRTAALIPWQEFGIRGLKQREALMTKNGWSREEDPDGILGVLEELHHKYFTVYWKPI